jgi:hypothetical protein
MPTTADSRAPIRASARAVAGSKELAAANGTGKMVR